MDKYACKYYGKKEFNTYGSLIWLQCLFYIKMNLIVIQIYCQIRKLESENFSKQ